MLVYGRCGQGWWVYRSTMPKSHNKYEIGEKVTKFFFDDETYFLVDTKDFLTVSKYKWHKTPKGYVRSSKGYLHRILTQCPNDKVVDHINHNTLDNTRANLRICTKSENNFNRLTSNPNSSTGERGISYSHRDNSYIARFSFNDENYHLGNFISQYEALIALVRARLAISEFSEIDNMHVTEEFKKQKELREQLYKKYKTHKSLPKFSIYCCGFTYAVNDINTYRAFKCFLHKPLSLESIKFCITYRFQCPKCGCVKTVTYAYNKDLKIVRTYTTKKTLKSIEFLRKVQDVLIKEMDLLDMITFKSYLNKPHSDWYYGVPVNQNIFKRKSLSGEDGGIVTVGLPSTLS